jgi:hypothetical protein
LVNLDQVHLATGLRSTATIYTAPLGTLLREALGLSLAEKDVDEISTLFDVSNRVLGNHTAIVLNLNREIAVRQEPMTQAQNFCKPFTHQPVVSV